MFLKFYNHYTKIISNPKKNASSIYFQILKLTSQNNLHYHKIQEIYNIHF